MRRTRTRIMTEVVEVVVSAFVLAACNSGDANARHIDRAVDTATATVAGSSVIGVENETDDPYWEVEIATPDGAAYE